jgi:predicted acylesterase/phospholipase RssA
MQIVSAMLMLGLTNALEQANALDQAKLWFNRNTSTPHKYAFAFAPGGLLFPYYLGAAYQLQALGLLKDKTPIGGTSAGSIVATAIAFGKTEAEVRASMQEFMTDVRNGDELKVAFRRQLELLVPEDAPERAKNHGLAIGYYEVYPNRRPHIVTSWESKEDFIQTVLASCNFPFYFSRSPLVRCRDTWAIDGMFSVESPRFGCPHLPGERTVAVVAPFVGNVNMSGFDASDVIQPGKDGMEFPDDVDAGKWMQWSLTPASDEGLERMIELGKAHVRKWAVQQKLAPGFIEWTPPWRNLNVQPAVESKENGKVPIPQVDSKEKGKWPVFEGLMPPWSPIEAPAAATVGALPRPRVQRWRPERTGTQVLRQQARFPRSFQPITQTALDELSGPMACLVALVACIGVSFVAFRSRYPVFAAGTEPLLVA